METIYIDNLFILNLGIDYLLLLVTGRICSMRLRRGFILLGAAVGALYSVLVVVPCTAFLGSWPFRLVFAATMLLISYWGQKHLFRAAAVFLAVSAAFGGAVYAVSMLGGTVGGRGLYVRISPKILFLSFAVCYCVLSLVFHRATDKASRKKLRVTARLDGRQTEFLALRDTGNGLYDLVSGLSVCVADADAVSPLFPEECRNCFEMRDPLEMFLALSDSPACRGRFRLVPYSALGTESGLLPAFRPDEMTVEGRRSSALIAVSCSSLCPDGEYSAIF